MKKKFDIRKVLGGVLVIVFLALIVLGAIFGRVQKPRPTPTPVPFELLGTIPASGSVNVFPVTTAVEFVFSKPINVDTLVLGSVPAENLTFETDQKDAVLFVRAVNGWRLGVKYQITISVTSKDGETLPAISYSFEVNSPKVSPLDERPTGR